MNKYAQAIESVFWSHSLTVIKCTDHCRLSQAFVSYMMAHNRLCGYYPLRKARLCMRVTSAHACILQ